MKNHQFFKTLTGIALVLAAVQVQAQTSGRKASRAKPSTAVQYRCDNGRRVSVSYLFGEATLKARVRLHGATRILDWDAHETDKEIEIFNSKDYQLVTDQFDIKTYRKAGLRQITRQTRAKVNGKWLPVAEILYRNCTPR